MTSDQNGLYRMNKMGYNKIVKIFLQLNFIKIRGLPLIHYNI